MRNKILHYIPAMLFIGLLVLFTPDKSAAQWIVRAQAPNSITSQFDQISAVNDTVVWVLRNNHTIKTVDGGKTWKRVLIQGLPNNFIVATICAIDRKTALIAGNTSFTGVGPGIVYRTADGGKTWQEVYRQTGNCFFAISMKDNKTGVMSVAASGFPFILLKTTNGGRVWGTQDIVTPSTTGGSVQHHHALYVLGNDIWFGTNNFKIFHSADFGLTWSTLRQMPGFAAIINSVYFQNTLDGIATVTNTDGVNVTHDGGMSWIHTAQPFTKNAFTQTALLVGGEGWFIPNPFDEFEIYHSIDNGNSWTGEFADSIPVIQGFYDLIKAPNTLWAISQQKIYSYALPAANKSSLPEVVNSSSKGTTQKRNFTCYPNPAAGLTNIQFSTSQKAQVSLTILNNAGVVVAVVENKLLDGGNYHYQFNFSHLPAGVYYCSLNIDNEHLETKIINTKN